MQSCPAIRCRFISYLAVCLLCLTAIRQAQAQRAEKHDQLISAVDQLVEKHQISGTTPGVAILIHCPGKFTIKKGYGLANLSTRQVITERTMFELASISKTFTSTAILLLHDRGALSIEDEVHKLLPELPHYTKSKDHPIRIRHLLTHTSGLPDYMDFEHVPGRHKTWKVNADYLDAFAAQKSKHPLEFVPGAKYEYNNTNFLLLAVIVERASRKPFNQFMRDEIFHPAGMTHTFVYDSPRSVPHVAGYPHAVGYRWRSRKEIWEAAWGTPPDRHEEVLTAGDGSIWTNLDDMARWDQVVREQKILRPATWELSRMPSRTDDGKTNDYGLGWDLYFDTPDKIYGFGHDGSWQGFETSYYRYLKNDRTTVFLSNRSTFDCDKLWKALDRILDKYLSG